MFNQRTKVKDVLANEETGHQVIVMGWVRTFRNNNLSH
jgi:asparaginyl-tRNA synthetase